MSSSLRHIPLIATITAAAVGGSVVGRAQSSASAPDTLSSLLIEVRGLRAAIEQMASAGPRVQLAMGRLQLQEQRVGELTRKLEEVKTKLASVQEESDMADEQIKTLEDTIPRTTDPARLRELEEALRHMKLSARNHGPAVQRLQGEQAAIAQDLANEQTRWADLNQRLDELERMLGK
jgi:chromosome segregation ATPase